VSAQARRRPSPFRPFLRRAVAQFADQAGVLSVGAQSSKSRSRFTSADSLCATFSRSATPLQEMPVDVVKVAEPPWRIAEWFLAFSSPRLL